MDLNQPVTNPALKRALEEMHRENTRPNQERALDELLQAQLLSPVTITPPPPKGDGKTGQTRLDQNTKIQFSLLTTQDGRSFFPAFTDWEELRKLSQEPQQQTLVLGFADYAAMILRDSAAAGLAVNPFGDSLTMERPMVEYLERRRRELEEGLRPEKIEKDTRVMVGEPAQFPQALADAVRERAAALPEVARIWLRLMVREGQESYLLVVDHTGSEGQLFAALAQAARPYVGDMGVDLVPYDSGLGRSAAQGQPFYQR